MATTRSSTTRTTRTKTAKTSKTGARRAARVEDPPPPTIDNPRIQRRRSKLHGWGVFALEPINKNKRIIHYGGELISNKQSVNREDRYLRKGCIWVFRVNRNWSRDANVGGNVARFINHACRPNCWVEVVGKHIWIRAARRIEAGEELTYDYNTEGDKTIPCRCRPDCKTRL
ncbi:MAG: SET domain-containing protein-lysine N-methyltransferase [Vicinamibacterales bacterium]